METLFQYFKMTLNLTLIRFFGYMGAFSLVVSLCLKQKPCMMVEIILNFFAGLCSHFKLISHIIRLFKDNSKIILNSFF